jgi:hypothetical protein
MVNLAERVIRTVEMMTGTSPLLDTEKHVLSEPQNQDQVPIKKKTLMDVWLKTFME